MIDPQPWFPLAQNLVGVVDLKAGVAVHGIAGKRAGYRSVQPLLRDGKPADGDPLALVQWYRRFQIRNFYLADLDALMRGNVQRHAIDSLLSNMHANEHWMIDIGVCETVIGEHANWMRDLSETMQRVGWILASESAGNLSIIQRVTEHLSPDSLTLGVDYRNGRFVGPDSGLERWLMTADRLALRRSLVLDVAAVGTSCGPQTLALCGLLLERFPHWSVISGGGCRSPQDVLSFLDAGCERCLIASALLPASR